MAGLSRKEVEEIALLGLGVLCVALAFETEHPGQRAHDLLLPRAHLKWMHPKLAGELALGFILAQRRQRPAGFERGAVAFARARTRRSTLHSSGPLLA